MSQVPGVGGVFVDAFIYKPIREIATIAANAAIATIGWRFCF